MRGDITRRQNLAADWRHAPEQAMQAHVPLLLSAAGTRREPGRIGGVVHNRALSPVENRVISGAIPGVSSGS